MANLDTLGVVMKLLKELLKLKLSLLDGNINYVATL
jgi:hypothetical protein